MEDAEIRKLLQVQRPPSGQRSWRCPDEIQLAAYVSQSGSTSESIEAHVADCDFCLSQVAFLTQSADWANSVAVPANLLSTARNLVARKPGRGINWGWRWAAASAALACFVLLIVVIAQRLRTENERTRPDNSLVAQTSPAGPPQVVPAPTARPEPSQAMRTPQPSPIQSPAVRGNTAAELLPKLITPRDGAVLRRDNLEFRWEPVLDAISYDVRVMSVTGDVVFEAQTDGTSLKPDSSVQLVPGTKYFVVTRAHLPQGKTTKSSIVSFRLAGH